MLVLWSTAAQCSDVRKQGFVSIGTDRVAMVLVVLITTGISSGDGGRRKQRRRYDQRTEGEIAALHPRYFQMYSCLHTQFFNRLVQELTVGAKTSPENFHQKVIKEK